MMSIGNAVPWLVTLKSSCKDTAQCEENFAFAASECYYYQNKTCGKMIENFQWKYQIKNSFHRNWVKIAIVHVIEE